MLIVVGKAPRECDSDLMVEELKGVDANTTCKIVACLIKDLVQAGEVKDFPLLKVIFW